MLLYCSLPLPVVVRELYRVIVSCRKDVACGLLAVLFIGFPCVVGILL